MDSKENSSIAKSALYNMIAKFGQMAVQLVVQMILARLIDASDFGIVAIITVALNFLNMFADMGLGVSIIQHNEIKEDDLTNIFTGTFYLGLILMGVMIIASYPVSIVYNNPIYIRLFWICSIVAMFNSLNVVPNALLMRRKRFDLIALRTVVVNIIAGIMAIIAAFFGAKYYALVINYIIVAVGILVWNLFSNRKYHIHFVLRIKIKNLIEFMGKYSLFQFLFNIMNYFTRNLDYMLIGAYMDSATLGYYQKAYTLNLYPNQLFTNVVSAVFHPYMKEYKDDPAQMYKNWISINELLSIVAAFVMCVMFCGSREIIYIMFGKNWDPAVACLHWLSICVWAQMLSSTCGAVFLSAGRTDQTLKCGIINIFIILFAVICGLVEKNINVLSMYIGIAYNVIFWITVLVMAKFTLHQTVALFTKKVLPDFVAAVLIMVLLTKYSLFEVENLFFSLILKSLMIGILLVVYLIVTRKIETIWNLVLRTVKAIVH